ncbi:hypothetical protein PybrP1_007907, partial [[Pythium] brassicae (nom. inval.)]
MVADDDKAKSKKRSGVAAHKSKSKDKDKSSDRTKAKSKGDIPAGSAKTSKRSRDNKESTKKSSSRSKKAAADNSSSATKADELSPAAPTAPPAAPAPPHAPLTIDADAVQLFRRYDCARVGAISRRDFLQLLRDYAGPLTDASGTPLGFERSAANSEFEAGQLFERYDGDHAGALSLDKFQRFFADFRAQLVLFAQDVGYAAARPTPAFALPHPRRGPVKLEGDTRRKLASELQDALWKLRTILKDELLGQRQRLLVTASSSYKKHGGLADDRTSRALSRWSERHFHSRLDHRDDDDAGDGDDDSSFEIEKNRVAAALYEAMEIDVELIDEVEAFVRQHLARDKRAPSIEKVGDRIVRADELYEQAQYVAVKEYALPRGLLGADSSGDEDPSEHLQQHEQQLHRSGTRDAPTLPCRPAGNNALSESGGSRAAPPPRKRPDSPPEHQGSPPHHQPPQELPSGGASGGRDELAKLLRVKDEMIYQLLLERTEMRRQKAAMEAYVEELSGVSTAEMKKWARLTDEMHAEIEHLRRQLQRRGSPTSATDMDSDAATSLVAVLYVLFAVPFRIGFLYY